MALSALSQRKPHLDIFLRSRVIQKLRNFKKVYCIKYAGTQWVKVSVIFIIPLIISIWLKTIHQQLSNSFIWSYGEFRFDYLWHIYWKKCIVSHKKADEYPWYYHIFEVENTTNFSLKNCTVVISNLPKFRINLFKYKVCYFFKIYSIKWVENKCWFSYLSCTGQNT